MLWWDQFLNVYSFNSMPHMSQSLWGLFLTPSHVESAPAFSHLNQHDEWLKYKMQYQGCRRSGQNGGAGVPELTSSLRHQTTPTYRATLVGTYLKTSRKEFPQQKQEAGHRRQPAKDKHHLPRVHSSCQHRRRTRAAHTDVTLHHVTLMTRGAFAVDPHKMYPTWGYFSKIGKCD